MLSLGLYAVGVVFDCNFDGGSMLSWVLKLEAVFVSAGSVLICCCRLGLYGCNFGEFLVLGCCCSVCRYSLCGCAFGGVLVLVCC